jgi:hypothetical protein
MSIYVSAVHIQFQCFILIFEVDFGIFEVNFEVDFGGVLKTK